MNTNIYVYREADWWRVVVGSAEEWRRVESGGESGEEWWRGMLESGSE